MMVEDESEVFEITDFTTASDWERFIARLEEQIHEWKLNTVTLAPPLTKGELTTGIWEEKSAMIAFADVNFSMTWSRLKQDASSGGGIVTRDSSMADVMLASASGTATSVAKVAAPSEEDDLSTIPVIWQDMMSCENTFPSRAHCLCRWYGLREFVTVTTTGNVLDMESRINSVLSSLSIAANNTGCQVPFLLQTHGRSRRFYTGTSEFPGFRTAFEMVELKSAPPQYSHLTGLLDVFKAKLAAPVSPLPPVSVAVRMMYTLQDWTHYSWTQQPPDMENLALKVGVTKLDELPFGSYDDPIVELSLSTTWPSLSEEMIVDSDVYSDLDPLQAPQWSVKVRFSDGHHCLLGDYLHEFTKLCSRLESIHDLLSRSLLNDGSVDVSRALHALTETGPYALPSLEKVVSRATSKLGVRPDEAPIPDDRLNEILLFLFPDAKSAGSQSPSSSRPHNSFLFGTDASSTSAETCEKLTTDEQHPTSEGQQSKDMFKQLKSAPPSSLTARLAACMCIVNHAYGGVRAVAHLWQEFVLEMRYRWDNGFTIPDLESGCPNMGCCLLHQKLQMLNCCIERRRARERDLVMHGDTTAQTGGVDSVDRGPNAKSSDDDDDEEFYECVDSESPDDDRSPVTPEKPQPSEFPNSAGNDHADGAGMSAPKPGGEDSSGGWMDASLDSATVFADSVAYQAPDGRLKVHGYLRLLNVDEPLYVPVTQEPAPMTEDMLEEHAEVLARLGTSVEGTHLRARMQSACLLSDMEAFKAANPGSTLGDFVRWYSPRDWIEEDVVDDDGNVQRIGELSQRMQIPGNMWMEVWQSARPVPARRQRRLFDDTKEAEKVLHWLASLTLADVSLRLMPMLVHCAISRLTQHEECQLGLLRKNMTHITNKATKATRIANMDAKRFEDLVRSISHAEIVVTRAQSLLSKFSREVHDESVSHREMQTFVSDLLEQPEVNVIGAARGPLGTIIHRLFITSQKHSNSMLPDDDDPSSDFNRGRSASVSPSSGISPTSEFPQPYGKEYILRMMINRPAPWSRPSPQRMYCVLTKSEFRLAGAFTSDTTFQ